MLPDPFDTLDENARMRLSLSKGDHVFRQGDASQGIFFVMSGSICLMRMTEAGSVVTLHNAAAGGLFAEASLYSDHYHCDAVATTSSEVLRLSKQAILTLQREDATFSQKIAQRFASQVQECRQLMTLLAVKSASERVFQAIASGRLSGSVTQFASQIGLSKEACYRALKDLCDQGVLLKTGRGQYALSSATVDRRF